jgi:CRP/FNR family transcriptional regulator, cyclic AMP receptor protein
MKKVLYLLDQFTDTDVEWLITHCSRERLGPGKVLIQEGQHADALYILLDGVLEVTNADLSKDQAIKLVCGEVVGEMSFIDGRPPSATVTAVTPAVVLAIPRTQIAAKLAREPEFAARFYRSIALFLSHRLRDRVQRMRQSKGQPVRDEDDELEMQLLDNIHLAGSRFDRVRQRLMAE